MQSRAMVLIAGIQVDLASLRPGKIRGKHGYEELSIRPSQR
jgi:hypothetical protein